MIKTTKLRGVGPSFSEFVEQRVSSVVLDCSAVVTVETFYKHWGIWQITFNANYGIRVLDELYLPEFWHCSIQASKDDHCYVVYEVIEGGWLSQQRTHSGLDFADPDLKEYLIGGDMDCVSVLSTKEPIITLVSPRSSD